MAGEIGSYVVRRDFVVVLEVSFLIFLTSAASSRLLVDLSWVLLVSSILLDVFAFFLLESSWMAVLVETGCWFYCSSFLCFWSVLECLPHGWFGGDVLGLGSF